MKLETLFNKELKQAIKQGADHSAINKLAGATDRKIVLTEAEAIAGKRVWDKFMAEKLWNDEEFGQGWLFGSEKTQLNIGLVPTKLSTKRLHLNAHNWDSYEKIF